MKEFNPTFNRIGIRSVADYSLREFMRSKLRAEVRRSRHSRRMRSCTANVWQKSGTGSAVLLGGLVSLPEMATTITASAIGNAPLAVNTLLGGIAAAMAMIAITDAAVGREPLDIDVIRPIVLFQGTLVILFLAVAAAGIIVGDVAFGGLGLWAYALLALYVLFVMLLKRYRKATPWVPKDKKAPSGGNAERRRDHLSSPEVKPDGKATTRGGKGAAHSTTQVAFHAGLAGVGILVAGFFLAVSGEAIGEQSGLGAGFAGMVLGGVATSLPELSTTISAVRLKQYEMAFADAFGANLFSVLLIFLADVFYSGGPVLNEVGRFSLFAILLGIVLTAIYLAGLIERRKAVVRRMGVDSLLVLLVYIGGLFMLYRIR